MKIAVVIPAYNASETLARVLSEIPEDLHAGVIVVDDGSTPPLQAPGFTVLRHDHNQGYGAAQKTGYDAALTGDAERVILLHGDGQYATADVLALAVPLAACQVAIGSRFLNMGADQIPLWRRWGNRTLTFLANLRYGSDVSELHSGARAFRAETLKEIDYHRFSDDYVFDHQVLVALLDKGATIGERKVRCTYDETTQSIGVLPSIKYALGVMRTIIRPPPD